MSKIFDKLFFMGPMTLGDNFVYSGIVHYYGDRCTELHVPSGEENFDTLTTLYQEHPHIKVVQMLPYDQGENQYVEKFGLSRIVRHDMFRTQINGHTISIMWDEQIYTQFELPFSLRYSNFRLPSNIAGSQELYQQLAGDEPYALVHRGTSVYPNGMPLDITGFRKASGMPDIKIVEVKPGITPDLMQYVDLIKNATEIHCVPSSFFCLVDSIHRETNARLFYHDVRANTIMRVNSKWNNYPWTMITYGNKI